MLFFLSIIDRIRKFSATFLTRNTFNNRKTDIFEEFTIKNVYASEMNFVPQAKINLISMQQGYTSD